MNAYIRNSWADNVIDPEGKGVTCMASGPCAADMQWPAADDNVWKPLKEVFPPCSAGCTTSKSQFSFTNAEIINCFVVRTAINGLPVSDMKGMNDSAMNLYRCGHIQQILVCYSMNQKELHIKANCIPEMSKDRIYHLLLSLGLPSFDIISAECRCPAGKGPTASCKHLGGLCFALEEFSRLGQYKIILHVLANFKNRTSPVPRNWIFFVLPICLPGEIPSYLKRKKCHL